MSHYYYQDLKVNVLDADTKEIIRNDFYVLCTCDGALGYYPYLRAIYNGEATFHNLDTSRWGGDEDNAGFKIQFDVFGDQFTRIGYDPNSIKGDVVKITFVEGGALNLPLGPKNCTAYVIPRVANIYVSKL